MTAIIMYNKSFARLSNDTRHKLKRYFHFNLEEKKPKENHLVMFGRLFFLFLFCSVCDSCCQDFLTHFDNFRSILALMKYMPFDE